METRISVRNLKVSDTTKDHIEKVCAKLGQFYDRIIDCEVVLAKHRLGTRVEFVVKVPQQTLVASAYTQGDNLFKAVAEARERLEKQVKKYHDKVVDHRG